ncbi:uncharacterized protein LOC141638935 isoform X1 [Silene latifolia]|uniref:uncharacterized protein LOC141638935 isoform X1 n=2 Tax=Silene latifolia TaxID=37657 RepID=UPI003D78AAFE
MSAYKFHAIQGAPRIFHVCVLPIMYPRWKSNLCEESLISALENDDKDVFMRVIKDKGLGEYEIDSFPATLFVNDAVEIAIAVFNGETKGILDMEDLFKDGMTPLHLAVLYQAPRLTKYLLQRGDKVDVTCDGKLFGQNVKHFTPFDCIFQPIRYSPPRRSLFEMLTWLCYHHRGSMEVIRMLVLYMQDTTPVRQKFVKYAHEDELNKLAALFIAVPELFLSCPGSGVSLLSKLKRELNPLVNNTDIKKQQLSLLFDIFAVVGHEIAAYIRLQEFCVMPNSMESYEKSYLEVDFFLREVVRRKLGVCSPDYYLSFFEAGPINYAPLDDGVPRPDWHNYTSQKDGISLISILPLLLDRKDFNRTDIYRLIPSLDPQDAARLKSAIEKKLSLMSSLHGSLKTSAKISEGGKHLLFPIVPPIYFPTKSLENKLILQTKLKPALSFLKPSQFTRVAKFTRIAKYLPK